MNTFHTYDNQTITNAFNALGRHAIDKITRYEGTITGIHFSITGFIQVEITPLTNANDYVITGPYWFELQRVEVTDG